MPSSFFATKSRKRKRPAHHGNSTTTHQKRPSKKKKVDEELSEQEEEWGGIADIDLRAEEHDPGASGDENEDETPAQKRLRLAQLHLDSIKEALADGEFDAADIDRDLISSRLKQDVLEHSGKVHIFIANAYRPTTFSSSPILRTRGHRFSVTSAVVSESNAEYLYTTGKEGSIIKWRLSSGKKIAVVHKQKTSDDGHTDQVLALALSSDGKYLASGGRDRRLIVWDADSLKCIKVFQGPMTHRDIISALSFRKSTHQLFTASFDRTLKLYDLTPSVMGYVETLYGHQDPVLSLDALRGEHCVSVGGRDTTARYWKIVDETQLVFRGGGRSRVREVLEGGLRGDEEDEGDEDEGGKGKGKKGYVEGSLECVAMIDETTFVTGGDSGSISLWTTQKKKSIFTHPLAHGLNEAYSSTAEGGVIKTPRWVTSLASLRYSDLFASGSWDGQIRLWKLESNLKSFSFLGEIPIPGVINSLQLVSAPPSFLDPVSPLPPPPPSSSSQTLPTSPIATPDGDEDEDAMDSTAAASAASPSHITSESRKEAATAHPASRISWIPYTRTAKMTNGNANKNPTLSPPPVVLLVAGVGQEHRLGRWMSLKNTNSQKQKSEQGLETGTGTGAVNAAYVVALLPS